MSAKDAAIQDMIPELEKRNKTFLAFHSELNPIMDQLVEQHIRAQQSLFKRFDKSNSQLMAHCYFCKSNNTVKFSNYEKYYKEAR